MSIKVNGNGIRTFFDCNAKWLERERLDIRFSEEQEEIKIQNMLISQKIGNEFFMDGLEFRGDENPLLILKNQSKIEETNIHQHLTAYDQVVHGTKYLSKNIPVGNQIIKLQERVDMVVNTLNPLSHKFEIKAYTFFYGDAKVEKELTFKDIMQIILLKDEYGSEAIINLHRINLKTNDTHIQRILPGKDYLEIITPTLVQMVNVYNNGVDNHELKEDCKVCPYYDYCGIQNVVRVDTNNIVDRILTLETELKQLKTLGKKYCQIHDGMSIVGSNGIEFAIQPETSLSFAGYRGKKHLIIEELLDGAEPEDVMQMLYVLRHHITIPSKEEVVDYLNSEFNKGFRLQSSTSYRFKKVKDEED